MQNWGDRELIIKQNDLLVTIILSEHGQSVLMGNPRQKSHMDGIFESYSSNKSLINAANFERTILSALSFTKARVPEDIYISNLLRMSHISVNTL